MITFITFGSSLGCHYTLYFAYPELLYAPYKIESNLNPALLEKKKVKAQLYKSSLQLAIYR